MSGPIEVVRATTVGWAPGARRLSEWAQAARGRRVGALCIRVVSSRESRSLNAAFRGQDHATNVLSFPAGPTPGTASGETPLGDIAICASVVGREARAQGKTLAAHWAHMVVHGVLHLCGHDHIDAADARRMERRERLVLGRLGFADPYDEQEV